MNGAPPAAAPPALDEPGRAGVKPPVRIAFADFPGPTNPDLITGILAERYEVRIELENPDYVIHSVFGSDYLAFAPSAIRIFFTGENVRPDFNLCDYAFGYDWLEFGDRHFRAPNFMIYPQWRDILTRGRSHVADLAGKPGFCDFIYSNGDGHPIRDDFFHALNAVEPVESFGRHLRNSPRAIGAPYQGDWSAAKVAAQRGFKFSIAFENSASPGYTTEKLVHALAADTIPIYWGDPLVGRTFNADRIVDVGRLGCDGAIAKVMALHRDTASYLAMVNRPFLAQGADIAALTRGALLDALTRIIDRPRESAIRRNPYFWGKKYEERRRREIKAAKLAARLRRLAFWA